MSEALLDGWLNCSLLDGSGAKAAFSEVKHVFAQLSEVGPLAEGQLAHNNSIFVTIALNVIVCQTECYGRSTST